MSLNLSPTIHFYLGTCGRIWSGWFKFWEGSLDPFMLIRRCSSLNLIRRWPNSLGCFLLIDREGRRSTASDIRGTEDGLGAGCASHTHGGTETGCGEGRPKRWAAAGMAGAREEPKGQRKRILRPRACQFRQMNRYLFSSHQQKVKIGSPCWAGEDREHPQNKEFWHLLGKIP